MERSVAIWLNNGYLNGSLFSAGAGKGACGQCHHFVPLTLLLKHEILGPSGYGSMASANDPMDH